MRPLYTDIEVRELLERVTVSYEVRVELLRAELDDIRRSVPRHCAGCRCATR